ncbi:MAG: helix-turn-helix domain-containing protein, partial [Ignavibacteriae bacterium]|nr:helix-turn-helix domain-containing protein [Ignavibacteriota bacterium]
KILGVSHATLKHLIAEGEIKAVKINTRYKISLSAIKEFTESVIINVDNDIETPSHQTADSILDELINKFSK